MNRSTTRYGRMCKVIGWAIALMLAACGSSTEIAPGGGSSTVEGAVVQVNPVLFVDDLANAPAGAQSVAGAEVKAFDVSGAEVATVTTAADGNFVIPFVEAGYLRLEVRLDPASAAPDATTAVTAYPDAVIQVNRTYTVSRADAIDLAMATVDQDALVTGSLQPLLPGTDVVPSGSPPGTAVGPDETHARNVVANEWMFFVEEDPYGDFANPCRYIFVDAETGTVTTVDDVFWPPLVNGTVLWGSLRTMFMVEGMDLDNPSDRDPDAVATPTEEVVQLPPPPAAEPVGTVQSTLQKHNTDAQSIFAIVWQCKPESYAAADTKRMLDLLTNAGVPFESNIKVIRSLREPRTPDFNDSAYKKALMALNAQIEARLEQGLHSTLVVYVTAHAGGAAFSEYFDEEGKNSRSVFPSMLMLTSTKACRVRVFLECCYARHVADDLAAEFDKLPPGNRHDYAIYAACRRDEFSYSIPAIFEIVKWATDVDVLPPAGGRFTTELMKHAVVAGGDITGLLDSTGTMIRTELETIFGTVDFITGNAFFHPSAIVKPAEPAFCLGTEESFISIPEDSVSFLHVVGSTPCPQVAGTFQVQNTGSSQITFTASSSNSAIDVIPANGSIPPGGSITLTVQFNCGTQSSFNSTVDVSAFDLGGGGEDTASIPVQATIS